MLSLSVLLNTKIHLPLSFSEDPKNEEWLQTRVQLGQMITCQATLPILQLSLQQLYPQATSSQV